MKTGKDRRYQIRAVIFDIQEECVDLKKALSDAGIYVIVPFFGLQVEATLLEAMQSLSLSAKDCLMLTNQEAHRKAAESMGMAVVGCVEGYFEIPKTAVLLESAKEVPMSYLDRIYCHEQGLPATIAETKRCFIRELTTEDSETLYEILSEEETSCYLPIMEGSREEELDKLRSYVSCVYPFFEYGYWGIFCKESGELLGRAGFREGSYPLEIGYVIKRSFRGRGVATEVVEALLKYAAEELDITDVFAKIDRRNKASLRVAEKCGIRVEFM